MAKILLTIAGLLILVIIALAIIVTRRFDERTNKKNNEEADKMFRMEQICPGCKTGKYTYDLDPKSEVCPYIGCRRQNKCYFYKPLEKEPEKSFRF